MSDRETAIAGVRVLGNIVAVTSDGSVVDLPSASQRRLLGLLALHAPRRLRSEWLADVLGISPGALRTTVSRLRTTLGSDVLLTSSTGYALGCDVDALQFGQAITEAADALDRPAALARALALWTGPVVEEFQGEEWAAGETARLTELHASTVDDYGDELISAGRTTDAVALLESQIARHPLRDRPRGLLIRAFARAGRQADALRAFQTYRTLLADGLGIEPSPDVVRIERRVATGWDGLDSGTPAPGPATEILMPLPGTLAQRVDFVGRGAEREALVAQLALARKGALRCMLLGGEPGIGKTTLLAEFARSVTAGGAATVLYGRCDETGVPLEPFRTVFDTCVEHAPLDLLSEHVARCGGDLARIAPRLTARVATTPAPTASDDATERFLTFGAGADLLGRIAARRPLVLMVDDLQWAEPTALLLLRHLARALADAPVLLVISRREPGEPIADVAREALAELERAGASHLHLSGFDTAELAALIATTTSGSGVDLRHVASTLQEESAGNPLYASQLIRHWLEGGGSAAAGGDDVPRSLRDVVWSRVHSLGDEVSSVLTAAAVLGMEFHQDVLLDMVDVPEPAVIDALDRATTAGMLVDLMTVPRGLRFVHALVASALYFDIGTGRRARMHQRAARSLSKSGDVIAPEVVVQLARHCARAGLATEALEWSLRAGDYAFEHLAPVEAADHYRDALDQAVALHRADSERADLIVRLGHALRLAGDPTAIDTLEDGAELAVRSGNAEALIRAALAEDRGFMRLDRRAPRYLAIVEAAVGAANRSDTGTRARLLALLAQSLIYTPAAERRVALAHEALTLADRAGDPMLLAQVAPAVVVAQWAPGNAAARARVAARGVAAAEASGDPRLEFAAYTIAYDLAIESADPVLASQHLARLRATTRAFGEPMLHWFLGVINTFDAAMAGHLEEAEALATANLGLGTQIGVPDAFTFFAGQYFMIGTFAGRHKDLFPLVEQAVRDHPDMVVFRLAYGIISAAVGREDIAREILHEGVTSGFATLPVDNVWTTAVIGYAILAIELGDVEAATKLLPIIEPFTGEVTFNGMTSQGPVAAYMGKLLSLVGQHELAEEHLVAALRTATAFGWSYHRATTLFALALARYRRLGFLDDESRAWLAEASELCHAGGFASWIGQIDALAAGDAQVTRT